nr:MAG TPA: hypothetical protein [Caudoviricetes sp.]
MLQVEHRGFAASPAWYALRVGGWETVSNIHPNALLREAGRISLVLLYHNSCKKKSGKLWNSLPLCCVCRISFKYASYIHSARKNIISHI